MKWHNSPQKNLHITLALVLFSTFILPSPVKAKKLPSLSERGWMGIFSGYERRSFGFTIDHIGQFELYLLTEKTKKRIGMSRTIKIYTEVLVENVQGELSAKRLKKDEGFSTELKAGLDHEEVKYQAETPGDAKVEVIIKYDKNRIILDGRVLDRGTFKTGKIYLSFKVHVPAMYGSTYDSADKKKIKTAMRKDRIKFTRAADKKRVMLKSYEKVDLAEDEMAKGGVTEIGVSMDSQEGNDFVFTTLDGRGVIDFENDKGPLWKGYEVKWKREFIEVVEGDENKAAKEISPLVIELK